eukprot:26307-Prorocentrum_minimum.AAC.1
MGSNAHRLLRDVAQRQPDRGQARIHQPTGRVAQGRRAVPGASLGTASGSLASHQVLQNRAVQGERMHYVPLVATGGDLCPVRALRAHIAETAQGPKAPSSKYQQKKRGAPFGP